MKKFIKSLFTLSTLLAAIMLPAQEVAVTEMPDPFFVLGDRVFSRAEMLALTPADCQDHRAWITENLPAIATFVLCERAGIHCSEALTRENLHNSLLLMSYEQRIKFDFMLRENDLTIAQWLDRESKKLDNQLAEATRRWYIKLYGSKNPITFEHIRAWYYRHMNLFRRTTLDPAKIYIIDPAKPENAQKIIDALRQGMPPAAAAGAFAEAIALESITDDLQKNIAAKKVLEDDFWLIRGERYIYLMRSDARTHIYIELDENLQRAIGDALYDALAKAILSETLKRDFSPEQLRFY